MGRKPLVYASCVVMALFYCGMAAAPGVEVVFPLCILFGVGNGMYLSVDYALACDVLPSLETAAESLGVWGVAAFLGSTGGPLLAGPLLQAVSSAARQDAGPEQYAQPGYTAVMLLGAGYVACAGAFLTSVKAR